jgi:predicted Zn-dependent protease
MRRAATPHLFASLPLALALIAATAAPAAAQQKVPQDLAQTQALRNDPRLDAPKRRYANGDATGAKREFETLCAAAPENGWLALAVAEFLVTRQDHAGAEPFARKACALLPDQPPAHNLLGACLLFTDRVVEAEQLYRAAAARFEGTEAARNLVFGVAMACAIGHKHQEAQEWFERALTLDPDNLLFHFTTAENLIHLHRLADAELHLRRAAGGPTHHPDAGWKLATVLATEGKHDEAERLFRDALREGPPASRYQATYQFAVFLLERGRAAEAEPLLKQSVAARPDDRMAWSYLARAQKTLDRNDEAAASLKRYRALQAAADRSENDYLLGLIRQQLTGGELPPKKD